MLDIIKRAVPILEIGTLATMLLALLYRATYYWSFSVPEGSTHSFGDVIDLGFAILLFLVCSLCAIAGVGLSLLGGVAEKRLAYRPFFIGVLSFLVYDIVHPHIPNIL